MSYLTVNGFDTQADKRAAKKSPETIGPGLGRAADASLRNNFQAKKLRLKAMGTPRAQADAIFLRQLLEGLGDHWPFDTAGEAYSDKGAAWTGSPTLPTGVTLVTATPTPKRGARALQIDANASHSIVLGAIDPLSGGYTVGVWYSLAAAAFDYYTVSALPGGTVNVWKNGVVQSPGIPAWLAVDTSANTLTLKGVAGGTGTFDDLVVIPAPISTTFATAMNTFTGSGGSSIAWPTPYPTLLVGGDYEPVTHNMMGETADGDPFLGVVGGAFTDTAEMVAINLREV